MASAGFWVAEWPGSPTRTGGSARSRLSRNGQSTKHRNAEPMTAYTIGQRIGSVKNDDAALIEPVAGPGGAVGLPPQA
jgi:hypothetical protein